MLRPWWWSVRLVVVHPAHLAVVAVVVGPAHLAVVAVVVGPAGGDPSDTPRGGGGAQAYTHAAPPPRRAHMTSLSAAGGLLLECEIRVFGWGMDMTIFQTFTFSDGQHKTKDVHRMKRYKCLIYSVL